MSYKKIHVLMYHYVRNIKNSKYPQIKGIEIDLFKRQLDFIENNFNLIRAEDLIDFFLQKKDLPEKPCLLTFDDGYKEHKHFVLPELIKRGISGVFFPPAKAILERELLDANAIHFILSHEDNDKYILKKILRLCLDYSIDIKIINSWKKNNFISNDKFDSAERILIKRLLQYLIPKNIKRDIISILFKEEIGLSCKEFADNFYLDIEDLKYFINAGMCIGGHGYNHDRLSQLSYDDQKKDINNTINFLKKIQSPTKNWIMCYPYGDYNNDTISILDKSNCIMAFKDDGGETILNPKNRFYLTRYDIKEFII